MIRNYHTTITDYIFNKKTFSELKESTFGDKWPVVYIIEDKGKRLAYIGETTNICNRINQHWNNPKRKKLKSIHIIHNPAFNINPAKRKAMAVKNEKRFLKQKRNALKNPGYSRHPVKTQASFKRLLKAV